MEVQVGVIGCGRIAWSLENDPLRYKPCTHIGALRHLAQEAPGLTIASLCDIKHENLMAAQEYTRDFQEAPRQFSDYRRLIAREPDVLVIATPTATHFEILSAALQAGLPSIVVEKPVCLSPKDARKLEKLAAKSNSRIWLNYERRYHPKYLKLKKILTSREFGFPLFYRGLFLAPNKELFPKGESEGVLLHDTTHLLDLVMFLFGAPDAYTGNAHNVQTQTGHSSEAHFLQMTHTEGVHGEIITRTSAPAFHFELEVLTEEARITTGNGFFHVEKIKESKHYENFYSLAKRKKRKEKKITPNRNPFIRLYQKVLTGAATPEEFQDSTLNVQILATTGKKN